MDWVRLRSRVKILLLLYRFKILSLLTCMHIILSRSCYLLIYLLFGFREPKFKKPKNDIVYSKFHHPVQKWSFLKQVQVTGIKSFLGWALNNILFVVEQIILRNNCVFTLFNSLYILTMPHLLKYLQWIQRTMLVSLLQKNKTIHTVIP